MINNPGATCVRNTVNNQILTISNFLKEDYIPGGDPITISFGEVINPANVKKVENFEVLILAEGRYVIDEYVGVTPWDLQTGTMSGVKVNPGSL